MREPECMRPLWRAGSGARAVVWKVMMQIPSCQTTPAFSLRCLELAGDAARLPCLLVIFHLPVARPGGGPNLHRRRLILRAIRRPVGKVGGDDVRLRIRMMEGRIDDARCNTIGNQRSQRGVAGAADELHPVAIANAALLGIMRMDFQPVFRMPDDILGPPRLRPDIVLAE